MPRPPRKKLTKKPSKINYSERYTDGTVLKGKLTFKNDEVEIFKKKFWKRVRDIRIDREMTQEELAVECHLDRTYISGIERGKRNPGLVNIGKIAEALRIFPHELMKF